MDRQLVYAGAIPLETDVLNSNKYAMIGLSKLAAAVLGTGIVVNGFTCIPTAVASLQVQLTAGEIYSIQNIDSTAYSSLAADTAHQIVKQGILLDTVLLTAAAPGTAGQSINWLVQVSYQDSDALPVVLPYYNASNPSVAYSGPNNAGTTNNTVRKGNATVSIKSGIAATTGSQTTPAPDAGYTGLFVVTVANGQTTITSPNITTLAGAPFITETLTQKLGQSSSQITAIAGGTADALTVAFTPAFTAIANQTVLVRAALANATTTPTIAINGISAINIVKGNNLPLAVGDIAGAAHWLELTLDATLNKAVLQNPATGATPIPAASNAEAQAQSVTNKYISPATLAAAFQAANQSLSASGYQKLPGGLILQWGNTTSSASADSTVTLPVAFPTLNVCVAIQPLPGSGTGAFAGVPSRTNTNFVMGSYTAATTRVAVAFLWFAIGY